MKSFLYPYLILFSVFICSCNRISETVFPNKNYADVVIKGKVYTSPNEDNYIKSVAIKNRKIIGLNENVENLIGPNTKIVHAEGLITNGFSNGNVSPLSVCFKTYKVSYSFVDTYISQVKRR